MASKSLPQDQKHTLPRGRWNLAYGDQAAAVGVLLGFLRFRVLGFEDRRANSSFPTNPMTNCERDHRHVDLARP